MEERTNRKRVLIVDDNHDAADMIAILVRLDGHCALVAYDTEDGLNLARRKKPDVIIHDIGMPRIDGYEAAHRLRDNDIFERTLLVALSANLNKERAIEAGFDVLLEKPVEYERLARILERERPATH